MTWLHTSHITYSTSRQEAQKISIVINFSYKNTIMASKSYKAYHAFL